MILSSPEHGLPGIQDLAIWHFWGWSDNFWEQQPGPSSMIRLGVWDQVSDERRGELVLFGPDGKGPAEISAGERVKREVSA